jgi:hypothetical protein
MCEPLVHVDVIVRRNILTWPLSVVNLVDFKSLFKLLWILGGFALGGGGSAKYTPHLHRAAPKNSSGGGKRTKFS